MNATTTIPVPSTANLLAAAEKARRGVDPVILEFYERRRRRAQAIRAREITEQAAHYYHQHPDNRLAELALHIALEQERQAEKAYLDPERLAFAYTRGV